MTLLFSLSLLVLIGDGRANSPGHSPKYGTCLILEMSCNKIIDLKLVQVWFTLNTVGTLYTMHISKKQLTHPKFLINTMDCHEGVKSSVSVISFVSIWSSEVKGSYHMEKEELQGVLKFLEVYCRDSCDRQING